MHVTRQWISSKHPNRLAHNWLIYDINDRYLASCASVLKGTLYDLGCGEMPYRDWLLTHARSYVGVDWTNSLHDICADIIADLNEPLPIENDVADTVISLSVMEHLREPQLFLSEAFRILKKSGTMVLQVPFMWSVHEAPHDYFRYTKYGLRCMLEKAGFSDIQIHAQTGFWVMWTLKLNYQLKRLEKGAWPIRQLIGLFLRIVWSVDQRVAPILDSFWRSEEETAGYFVIAKKA